ncbi:MAG: hypothetical protein ABSE73_08305 [Planctomycetota bacterium]
MSTFVTAVVMALLFSMLAAKGQAQEDFWVLRFHVAPNGDDKWSGRSNTPNAGRTDGPFATVGRAQQAARQGKPNQSAGHGPIVVELRGGVYYLAEPIVLTPEDSDVIYQAAPNETPVLSGGTRLTG